VKVVHIITGLGVGGAENALMRLLLSDSNSINRSVIISLTDLGSTGLVLKEIGYAVYSINLSVSCSSLAHFYRLVLLIRSIKPDVVQTWMYHADLIGGFACRLAGFSNLVWGVRATNPPLGNLRTKLVMKLCARLSYVLPKRIICVAESAKESHIKFGYSASKMVVIPNGLDFTEFEFDYSARLAIRAEHLLEDSVVIGCVGRYHEDKGQDVLVRAAALVLSRNPNVKFVLVGRGCDSSNHALVKEISDFGLSDQIVCLGERSDIIRCLSSFDVFCMPSRTEGFPNCLLEAMSLYLPCVATDVGDVRYLASDSMTLAQPGNPDSLANSINEMLSMSSEQRYRLGGDAGRKVRELFSIDKTKESFNKVYVSLVGNKF